MKNVLVVEDEVFLREMYQISFEKRGFEAVVAANGKEAYEYMKEQSFSAIVLDVMMPQMDGLALLSHLEEHPVPFDQGPIILLSNLESEVVDLQKWENPQRKYPIKTHFLKINVLPKDLVSKVQKVIEDAIE